MLPYIVSKAIPETRRSRHVSGVVLLNAWLLKNAQSVMSNGHSHMNIQSAIRSLVASGRAHILSCYIRQFVYTHTHTKHTLLMASQTSSSMQRDV